LNSWEYLLSLWGIFTIAADATPIAAGPATCAGKRYVRHHNSGAWRPNPFATKHSDQRFPEKVMGRKGTQAPAFNLRLWLDEVWQIHDFVKSRDHCCGAAVAPP
jgi:hypothetical protein